MAHPISITGIDRSYYMVTDLARALEFYRDVLGLEPESSAPDGSGVEYGLADGSTFGLWCGGDAVPFQPGYSVLFAVPSLAEATSALRARGIPIVEDHETPVCRFVLIRDTEGNTVTLHQRKT